jgi:hypothetical protein
MLPPMITITALLPSLFLAAPERSAEELFRKVAERYEYAKLENLKVQTDHAEIYFGGPVPKSGKDGKRIKVVRKTPFFHDQAVFLVTDSTLVRKVFSEAPADTGSFPGLMLGSRQFASLGPVSLEEKSPQDTGSLVRLKVGNFRLPWFTLGQFPAKAVVNAVGHLVVDPDNLRIASLEVDVDFRDATEPDRTYLITLLDQRLVQGCWIPHQVQYSIRDIEKLYPMKALAGMAQLNEDNKGYAEAVLKRYNSLRYDSTKAGTPLVERQKQYKATILAADNLDFRIKSTFFRVRSPFVVRVQSMGKYAAPRDFFRL